MALKARNIQPSPLFIRPASGWVPLNLGELWEYRELLYFLTWRDIKVRYKQTVLGVAWAVIQPLGMMLVFTIFFGHLVGVPSDGLPYPIFAYTALLPWQLFSRALTDASTSLVVNERLITKVYFPRLLIPVSAVLASLVDFAIAFVLLLGMMVFYGIVPTGSVLMLPLFVLLALMTALGIGFWLPAYQHNHDYDLPPTRLPLPAPPPRTPSRLDILGIGKSVPLASRISSKTRQ